LKNDTDTDASLRRSTELLLDNAQNSQNQAFFSGLLVERGIVVVDTPYTFGCMIPRNSELQRIAGNERY
jgi:hypothetical protein